MNTRSWMALIASLAVLIAGCGGPTDKSKMALIKVHGSVMLNGKPIPGAVLTFHPAQPFPDGDHRTPFATVNPDGKFEVTTWQTNDGIPEGIYRVAFSWSKQKNDNDNAPELMPEKYLNEQSSGVEVTIKSGVSELPAIDLRS